MTSAELLEKTGQKYFDRRLRELRDELGYDLESGFLKGQSAWRLRSTKRLPQKPRSYLGKSGKESLLQGWAGSCALCGKNIKATGRPVFDHRIPLIRGGLGTDDNFQLLCVDCNNQKRSQCRGCEFECKRCYLAFPENFPAGVVLRPKDKRFWDLVVEESKRNRQSVEDWILTTITAHLTKKR